ncbi:MAG: hypothetical protein JJU19_03980 [Pararhodobacter sp.]|nr:hypothetical protein [Pararhodobacter sp.]
MSDYPDDVLKVWPDKGVSSMLGSPAVKLDPYRNSTSPKEGQITITFNLDQPLSENLAMAERVLRREQEHLGRVIQKPHNPKGSGARARIWLQYLRVMDGEAAMARKSLGQRRMWDHIGAVVYESDQSAGEKARKAFNRACKLAANFP